MPSAIGRQIADRVLAAVRRRLLAAGVRTAEYQWDIRTLNYSLGVTASDGRTTIVDVDRADIERCRPEEERIFADYLVDRVVRTLGTSIGVVAAETPGAGRVRAFNILKDRGYSVRVTADGGGQQVVSLGSMRPTYIPTRMQEVITLGRPGSSAYNFGYTQELLAMSAEALADYLDDTFREANGLPPRTREASAHRGSPLEDRLATAIEQNKALREENEKLKAIISALKGEDKGTGRRVRLRGRG